MSEGRTAQEWSPVRAVSWEGGACVLLDQRLLPAEETYLRLESSEDVARAIRDMVVRGAPAIGITAAYGAALAYRQTPASDRRGLGERLRALLDARPTASNLKWAIARVCAAADASTTDPCGVALREALDIHAEDVAMNHAMGRLGADLIDGPCTVVTHCNAGALATGGFGTALGVIRQGFSDGRIRGVFAGETRPWQQGSRLTCWELARDGIPVTLLTDSAMGQMFRRERPAWLIVGADRIAANGDVANKIGTYALSVLARHHGARVMVVAPHSTIDPGTTDGDSIPIEERSADEIWAISGLPEGLPGASVRNPVFDVTPAECIDVIVTDRGIAQHPDFKKISELLHPTPPGSPEGSA
jgi:methylthioribose-1-phosphate isomerase